MLITVLLVVAMILAVLAAWPKVPQVSLLSLAVAVYFLTLVLASAKLV